jgi:hypothetical protein
MMNSDRISKVLKYEKKKTSEETSATMEWFCFAIAITDLTRYDTGKHDDDGDDDDDDDNDDDFNTP